jgi:hypothetical protein
VKSWKDGGVQRDEQGIIELVNLVVDGEATEAERAELTALVETSPATRAELDGVRDVARRLDQMETAAPPSELRSRVLWQIRRRQSGPSGRRRVLFGLGWAAAAAFLLAVVLVDPFGFRSHSDSVATMAPYQWPEVAEFPHLTVRKQRDLYSLEPRIGGPISIDLDRSLEAIGVSGGTDASFDSSKASFTLRPGERAAVIVRRHGSAPSAEVRMRVGDQLFTTRFVLSN